MGMYYRAVIVVGLPRKDLPEALFDEDGYISELDVIAPMFDGYNDEEAIVGYIIQQSEDYGASELSPILGMGILPKMKDFFLITGLEPKVWLSPQCT